MPRIWLLLLSFLPFATAGAQPLFGFAAAFGDKGMSSMEGMATDAAGNIYIVGTTTTDIPLLNPIQSHPGTGNCSPYPSKSFQRCESVFAAKFDPSGTKLIYSTYLGDVRDLAAGIAVDRDGNAFVAGTSRKPAPFGLGAGQAWVRKLNAAGSAVLYDRVIQGDTVANAIAVDARGNAYLAGASQASDFGAVNALQPLPPNKPVYASNDGGATWSALSNLPDLTVFSLAVDPARPATLYAAASSGVFKSTDSGAKWTRLLPDAKSAAQVIVDPRAPATLYLLYTDAIGSQVGKSTDGGATWQVLTTAIPQAKLPPFQHYFGALGLDPADPSVLWLSDVPLGGPAIYRSKDGGASWTDVHDFPAFFIGDSLGGSSPGILVDPRNSSRVYACCVQALAGVRSAIFRTDNGGATWVAGGQGPTAGNSGIAAPRIDRGGVLYASWWGGLVRSSDAGGTWTAVALPAGAPTAGYSDGALAIDASGALLLVNDNGTFLRSVDSGATWTSTSGPWRPGARILNASGPTLYIGSPYTGLVQHAFAAKLDSDGSILWATLLAGSGREEARAIATDDSGNAYVAGRTDSKDFPLADPYQNVKGSGHGAGYDAFLSKISSDGSKLLYSTFLGGSGDDVAQAVAVDGAGNAYVAGGTTYADFPTVNAFQTAPGKWYGASFVSQFDPAGCTLLFSTFLNGTAGWSFDDSAKAIALDASGALWVAGQTGAVGFPLVNPVQAAAGPAPTGYIVKLANTAQGFSLDFSTYLGGNNDSITTLVPGPGSVWIGGKASSSEVLPVSSILNAYLARLDLTPPVPVAGVPLIVSVYNAASFRPAGKVAPGELVTLFGAELAPAAEQAQSFPLPTTLQGTRVMIGDAAAPLLYVSPGQINFQVPYDVSQTGASITVQRGGKSSVPRPAGVLNATPGIFTLPDGYATPIVVHASDFTLVTPQRPARPGEYLAIFCNGLGATNPAVRAGEAAPAAPIEQRYDVVIDSRLVDVASYAGLAPGFAGLYQVNFQVPTVQQPGTGLLYLSVGGSSSNLVQLYVQAANDPQ
jgi:uncharacterized protein (TIGR03437 family)